MFRASGASASGTRSPHTTIKPRNRKRPNDSKHAVLLHRFRDQGFQRKEPLRTGGFASARLSLRLGALIETCRLRKVHVCWGWSITIPKATTPRRETALGRPEKRRNLLDDPRESTPGGKALDLGQPKPEPFVHIPDFRLPISRVPELGIPDFRIFPSALPDFLISTFASCHTSTL